MPLVVLQPVFASLRRVALRLVSDRRGGVMTLFALSLPALLTAGAATVTYGQITTRRAELQLIADAAALAASREITLANATAAHVVATAESTARSMIAQGRPEGTSATPSAEMLPDRAGVTLSIAETVATRMGQILSYPTYDLRVSATARVTGSGRICLIALEASGARTLHLRKDARLSAEGCALYANSTDPSAVTVEDRAVAVASLVCSAGGVREGKKGASVTPAARTGCPPLSDPLAGRPAPPSSGACANVDEVRAGKPPRDKDLLALAAKNGKALGRWNVVMDTGAGVELSPGIYCNGLLVNGGAKVRLKPGIYVMRGALVVDDARLQGENVGFYFEGDRASLLFEEDSSISLTAPKDGEMAGLLMFEERRVNSPVPAPPGKTKGASPIPLVPLPPLREYRIISDDAQVLLGTIYLPSGRLMIDSKRAVADRSTYTVIVTRRLELFDGPNLVLNSNYAASDIPVPKGVGPVPGSAVSLTR